MARKRVTLKSFTEAVTAWLVAERATVEEAMALDFALHAGLIDGQSYKGERAFIANAQEEDLADEEWAEPFYEYTPAEQEAMRGADCGCLLDTLERQGGRRRAAIRGNVLTAFVGATWIAFGDTPANDRWARAAHKGIEQYLAQKGA